MNAQVLSGMQLVSKQASMVMRTHAGKLLSVLGSVKVCDLHCCQGHACSSVHNSAEAEWLKLLTITISLALKIVKVKDFVFICISHLSSTFSCGIWLRSFQYQMRAIFTWVVVHNSTEFSMEQWNTYNYVCFYECMKHT